MISVSSSEIGLGFGGIEEDNMMMEDSDFEEEESTHSYVSCVDPDVALSYIDEKLENVLGHFQKDFEGGVSAENLGAKYGGYGSFLSMYQRSPACKSPPEVVGQSKCSTSSAVPQVSVPGSSSKAPPASDVLVKMKNMVKSSNIGAPDSKRKSVNKTSPSSSSAPSNHKTLKLRIKVGSSKQGLNMPPSTSRVNCLSGIEEGLLNGVHDSPTKILMAMVSFPLHKDQLLSPLSDDLIQLGKKGHIMKDAQKCVKKEKLKERVKYMPPSNRLDGNHIVSDTEIEADKQSYEELVSKTMKLPLLSCLSPSSIHRAKETDKISDSYVEGNAVLMGSKPEPEAFPDGSVEGTERVNTRKDVEEGEALNSSESKSKREKAPDVEHVDPVVKVSKSETRNEEQILKSKLPKAHKSQKSSSRNSLRGKDAAVNIINTNVPDKLQEDIVGSEDVYEGFFGVSGEAKEQEQSSLVLEAKKEKLSEESALKESFNSVRNDEEAIKCEPDSKHPIKSSDLYKNRHNNKHSIEGGMKHEPERELSGTCKKPKTGKSRFSAVDQLGSNKVLDVVNKTDITQASAQKVKDNGKASPHDGHEDRKRKQKESSGEKVRKKKRLKDSSCDGKELPISSESCDRDRIVTQENGRDSASHQPLMASSPSLLCKDLGSEIIRTNVQEAKGPLVDSPALSDPRELKSGRISERDEHHDTDTSAGDTRKRRREGGGYGTTKKAAESSKDNNLLTTEQATHSWDKERADGENCSIEKYKPKKSGRYSGDSCTDSDSQRKNRGGGSSAPSKENHKGTANEVQDLGAAVELKTKESRNKKRSVTEVSMESKKEDSREYQDPINKLEINSSHMSSPQEYDRAKSSGGKSNHLDVTADKLEKRSVPPVATDQVKKTKVMRNDNKDVGSRNQNQNGSTHSDQVGSSPLKKEITSQAASNSIKEATDLKHIADRLKNAGSNHESIGFYFQAALKFLHGASLLESSGTENATHKNIATSKHIYGSTAKLCKFCAHEYEKDKDMGAAALAYKCMEVAYLRITYSSHGNINRYKSELEASLQAIPSGESPSFASDGENPNQTMAAGKVSLSTPVRSSPKVIGNHVLSSGNNSSLSQLLTFSQNVSLAMDASRKAQTAFAVAKGKPSDTRYSSNGITSIKRALDFSFQDMEKLVHAVRLAMESINR